jgi:hypothetical protein
MALFVKIYFNAVYGALGGLLGWMLFGIFGDANPGDPESAAFWRNLVVGGALIGGAIGYLVVSVEAIRDHSLVRFCRLATYGVALGALGGMVGMLLAEKVHDLLVKWIGAPRDHPVRYLLGTMFARGLGWTLLGVAVGVSEGVAARSLGKMSYGTIGGAIGGFVGGALFGLVYVLSIRQDSPSVLWGAVGLVILGACIGSLSALVKGVLQPASVKVMRGWQEGREYPLDKDDNTLGRDEHADIALFRDMRVEKKHAIIQREGNRYILVNNNAPADYTRVNGVPVPNFRELQDGDRIELGHVVLKFQLRAAQARKKKVRR